MMNYFKQSVLTTVIAGMCMTAAAQTATKEDVPKGWHLQDLQKNGYYGISLDKAYEFLKNKKSKTVVVAVIDSGIDTTHEDLRPVLWTNPKEIAGNGKDDDGNGYIDDVHGWNFLGGKDGRNVKEDSYEVARVYHKFKAQFQNVTDPSALSKEDQENYAMWTKARRQVEEGGKDKGMELMILQRTFDAAAKADSVLKKALGKEKFTGTELQAFTPATEETKRAKSTLLYFFQANNTMEMTNQEFITEFNEYLSGEKKKADAATNAPKDYRGEIVKDNYSDFNDRFYGNPDVMANTPYHGTHVSGIIAAVRNNGKGIDGIADNVKIMAVRAVPDGDEHDKDVALAIRYAVDNGAKVINMSFGKSFSPEKSWVDEAVKYAQSKGVLLVHAAGNEGANIDTSDNFPTPVFKGNSGRASNWITVGASGDPKAGGLVASFSNYGKKEVDVFDPGVKIYSTIPGGNTYGFAQGTSMASPVVAGVAALILEYYPNLTPEQVKYVIENSAVKPTINAAMPQTGSKAALADISVTGGVINAYEAIKMADFISKGGKIKDKTDDKKIKVKDDKLKVKDGKKKETYKAF